MTERARPSRPILDSSPEEESRVRRTSEGTPAPRPRMSSAPGEITPHERLERKLRVGRQLLTELPAGNEHARLLSVAVMRRDEALLDGVLAALGREI